MNTCRIKIGGKKRTFKFNLHTDNIICRGMEITPSDFAECLTGVRQIEMQIWIFLGGLFCYLEQSQDEKALEEVGSVTDAYHKLSDWLMTLPEEDKSIVLTKFMEGHFLKNDSNNGQSRKGGSQKKN